MFPTMQAPDSRREWAALAGLSVPSMLVMIDVTVLFMALPQIAAALRPTAAQLLWIGDIYQFLIAGFLITMGRLGDRYGRRRVLLVGAGAFGAVSVLAAYSASPWILMGCRAALGVAGATILPNTLAIISEMFRHPRQRATAIAVWATALSAGSALGPVIGGMLLQSFWWGSVFLVGAPVMLAAVVAGAVLLPGSRAHDPGRLDPASVLLSLAAILAVVYGLKEIASTGWRVGPVLSVLAGVAIGGVFLRRQRGLSSPLLDVRVVRVLPVWGALLLSLTVAAIQGGGGYFISQYLQLVRGMSPLSAGLWMLIPATALVLGIFGGSGAAQRIRPAFVLTAGAAIAATGELLLSRVSIGMGLALPIIAFTLVFLGVGPVGPLVSRLVLAAAPAQRAASVSGLQSTSGDLGIALGVALFGSIGNAVYSGAILVPSAISGSPDGHLAGQTIVDALAVAGHQPAPIAEALADSARAAFTSGLATVAVVCAIACTLLTVLITATLNAVRPLGTAPAEPLRNLEDEAASATVPGSGRTVDEQAMATIAAAQELPDRDSGHHYGRRGDAMGADDRGRAVVLGAGMAGLLAARVLAEEFQDVLVVDRDQVMGVDHPRRGVPHGRHAHALLARGQQILLELFPGLDDELAAASVPVGDLAGNLRWYFNGRRLAPAQSGLLSVSATRPVLEAHVRARVAALDNVRWRQRCVIRGLVASPDQRRITGVRLVDEDGDGREDTVDADLVVDATGRGSRTPVWLANLGYEAPPTERVHVDLAYTTRHFRLKDDPYGTDLSINPVASPANPRGAFFPKLHDGSSMLSLTGILGDHPPADPEGFMAFAKSVAAPEIFAAIKDAEPLDDPVTFHFPASVRRRYERLRRFPEQLLVIGDAVCSFNPVYGQGMTVAATEAMALRDHLRDAARVSALRFFWDIARFVDNPWEISAGADLGFPGVKGVRTIKVRLGNAYMARLHAAAVHDARVTEAFFRVAGLVDPPTALMRPRTILRVLNGARTRPDGGPYA